MHPGMEDRLGYKDFVADCEGGTQQRQFNVTGRVFCVMGRLKTYEENGKRRGIAGAGDYVAKFLEIYGKLERER